MIDLSRPPYADFVDLLAELRASEARWDVVRFQPAVSEGRGTFDRAQITRDRVSALLWLSYAPADLELTRFLLEQETEARREDSWQGAGDTLTILSLILTEIGDRSDTWRFWNAKVANFDTSAGGYDVEFVLTWLPAREIIAHLEASPQADDPSTLEEYDLEALEARIPKWLDLMRRRYPRDLAEASPFWLELFAELFEDWENVERYGLMNATTPPAKAHLYRRLGRPSESLAIWREEAAQAPSAWHRVSALTSALEDAAQAGASALDAAEEIDRVRVELDSWSEGLGSTATKACFALAAASTVEAEGRALYTLAERWRAELHHLPLGLLRAAKGAAERWGSDDEVRALDADIRAWEAKIDSAPSPE